jgi:hypothetical protein
MKRCPRKEEGKPGRIGAAMIDNSFGYLRIRRTSPTKETANSPTLPEAKWASSVNGTFCGPETDAVPFL